MRGVLGVTYYQPRSYGEMAVLRGRGLGAADETSAESIFGKIVGGLAQVATAVIPAVVKPGATAGSTVDDLLKRLTAGTAIQPTTQAPPATTAMGGISTNTLLLIAALGVGGYLVLGRKRGR